jgi:hypothetical protein
MSFSKGRSILISRRIGYGQRNGIKNQRGRSNALRSLFYLFVEALAV